MRWRGSDLLVGLALGIACAVPAAASAAVPDALSADDPVARSCAERLLDPAAAGADRASWTAPSTGYLTVELRGGSEADWDLAVFDESSGKAVAASSSFTSQETATAWVESGDRLAIQGCRRSGSLTEIPLRLDLYEMKLPDGPQPRISMESVAIPGGDDVAELYRLGLDVTHDVEHGSVSVATYSDAERARLARAGFESTTEIRDMVAADAADRASEARAVATGPASPLPSGRESYRVYEDYTSEMKMLAEANPTLVRSIVIGETFEGRPIEGVEIASNVNSTDDGRPVFLNFGLHHAREWPSGELPMEFAIDLVQRFNAGDARVAATLANARVVIVPVVNADGFIASRSFGTSPADDDSDATLALAFSNKAAYIRKNCRPTLNDGAIPCSQRTGSGVDLNRNYGAFWGGPGSSTDPSSQSFRGSGPFSEPESEAVHQYTAGLHPTVFISNHTFTEGRWLRQPGFDADFLPQIEVPTYRESCPKNPGSDGPGDTDPGAITPDEAGMDSLGDAMAAANGWISELGYETLCDITGATEDWNYFSQGTYGYTPEVRGANFHANYASMVVAEYVGGDTTGDPAEQETNPLGMRESYLIAAERAGNDAEHSVIEGPAPPGAILTLRKQFETPTCESAGCPQGNGPSFTDTLVTRLTVPADGTYEWDVNPSARPQFPGETYTMTCRPGDGAEVSRQVAVARGQRTTQNFTGCGPGAGGLAGGGTGGGPAGTGGGAGGGAGAGGAGDQVSCAGRVATIFGTAAGEVFKGTSGVDVIVGAGGRDKINTGKGKDIVCASSGRDQVRGGGDVDKLRGDAGRDRLRGGNGADRLNGGGAKDRLRGGPGADRLNGAGGKDRCNGGPARDRLRSCR